MSEFETYRCENCGTKFEAVEGANAAELAACSPSCHAELA
jgi:predicted nucleic acid-binding Zn ribbon protein